MIRNLKNQELSNNIFSGWCTGSPSLAKVLISLTVPRPLAEALSFLFSSDGHVASTGIMLQHLRACTPVFLDEERIMKS